jgi:ParB/RepB/Spo0J family partition protein
MTTAIAEGKKASSAEEGNGHQRYALVSEIAADPEQPRRDFPESEQAELCESVKVNGILEPLVVRAFPVKASGATPDGARGTRAVPKWMLVEGERRWRVAPSAGLERVPIVVKEFKDDAELRKFQRIVGTQRLNLNALEQAGAFANEFELAKKVEAGLTLPKFAESQGVKRSVAYEIMALTKLCKPLKEALLSGKIDASKARLIATVPGDKQEVLLNEVLDADEFGGPRSVEELREYIQNDYRIALSRATFDLKRQYAGKIDEVDLKKAGTCEACPFRTGNMLEEFPDLKSSPNICTRPECFRAKCRAHVDATLSAAKAKGQRVLGAEDYTQQMNSLVGPETWCYDCQNPADWKKLMGKHAPEPILCATPNNEIREYWTKAEAKEAAIKNGIKWPKPKAKQPKAGIPVVDGRDPEKVKERLEADKKAMEDRKKEEQKRVEEMRLERERAELMGRVGDGVWSKLRTTIEKLPSNEKTERGFLHLCMSLASYQDNLAYGTPEIFRRRGNKGSNMSAVIKNMKLPELRSLFLEVLIGTRAVEYDEWNEDFAKACDFAGIDLKAEVKAESEKKIVKPAKGQKAVPVKKGKVKK